MKYPLIRTSQFSYDFIKGEAAKLGTSMTELLDIILRTYAENPDQFSELTGGIIGRQPAWQMPVKEYHPPQQVLL